MTWAGGGAALGLACLLPPLAPAQLWPGGWLLFWSRGRWPRAPTQSRALKTGGARLQGAEGCRPRLPVGFWLRDSGTSEESHRPHSSVHLLQPLGQQRGWIPWGCASTRRKGGLRLSRLGFCELGFGAGVHGNLEVGSSLEMRPVVKGQALLSGGCAKRSCLAFVLRISAYREHIQTCGWPGPCKPGRTWGTWPSGWPSHWRLFKSTRRHGAEVFFPLWPVTSYLPRPGACLMAAWAVIWECLLCPRNRLPQPVPGPGFW